jgi:pyruvate/2-oxoglutarate dehydrogenase complex dihydrolipoamide acyltransferase (E2) component
VIAEIETDKATVEMEAFVSGKLVEIVHPVGDEVPVGEVIGYIEDGA